MKMDEKHRSVIRALVYDRRATITNAGRQTRAGDVLHLVDIRQHTNMLEIIYGKGQEGNRAERWFRGVNGVLAFRYGGDLHGELLSWYVATYGALGVCVGASVYRLDRDPINRSRYVICAGMLQYGSPLGDIL